MNSFIVPPNLGPTKECKAFFRGKKMGGGGQNKRQDKTNKSLPHLKDTSALQEFTSKRKMTTLKSALREPAHFPKVRENGL